MKSFNEWLTQSVTENWIGDTIDRYAQYRAQKKFFAGLINSVLKPENIWYAVHYDKEMPISSPGEPKKVIKKTTSLFIQGVHPPKTNSRHIVTSPPVPRDAYVGNSEKLKKVIKYIEASGFTELRDGRYFNDDLRIACLAPRDGFKITFHTNRDSSTGF